MKRFPLWLYGIGVVTALTVVNWIYWLRGDTAKFCTVEHVSLGFVLGMLAMYIAMHLYRWKGDKGSKGNQ